MIFHIQIVVYERLKINVYFDIKMSLFLLSEVMTLEELFKVSEETRASQAKTFKAIPKGQSVVWAKPAAQHSVPPRAPVLPYDLVMSAYYCHYCSIQCNSLKQWDEHCASEKHMFNVNSDKEHQWNYRQPPWGVTHGRYKLCDRLVAFTSHSSTVERVLRDCPITFKNRVSQDRWSLVTGSVILKCSFFCQ